MSACSICKAKTLCLACWIDADYRAPQTREMAEKVIDDYLEEPDPRDPRF